MNKIFRIVWSYATQSWVVVSELTKAHKKQSSSNSLKAALGAATVLLSINSAEAAVLIGATENDTTTATKINNQSSTVSPWGITIGGAISKAGDNSVHIGDATGSVGTRNVVIGTYATAGYDEKKPADNPAKDGSFNQSVAIGAGSAAGQGARAYGDQSIAIGSNTIARGNSSIAIGNDDVDKTGSTDTTYTDLNGKTKTGSIANAYNELTGQNLGVGQYQDTTSKEAAVAIGVKSVAGDISLALGTGANADRVNAVAIGTGATANRDNAVAIGGGSTTDAAATSELKTTVNGLTFNWAGGERTISGDVVSFGKEGYERQLKHVSPGKVSATSTDAINGSQLYGVLNHLTSDPVYLYGADDSKDEKVVGDDAAKKTEDAKAKKIVARSMADSRLDLKGGATGELTDNNIGVKYENEGTIRFKLAKALSGLTSAEFKDANNNVVNITPTGVSFTKPNANTVTVNQDGLNNGGNAITNVAGNLQGSKASTTAPTTNATAPNDVDGIKNNAATVGDVLNAGWNLQNNSEEKDFVKPYDTVNFADGNGTTAVVNTTENKTSTVKYNVNLGNGLKTTDNKITVKPADKSLEVNKDGVKVKTDGTTITTDPTNGLKVVTGGIEAGTTPGTMKVTDGDDGKIATVDSVVNAVNNAAFTLKASAGDGTRNGNGTVNANGESIKAGSTIEMIAGKNLDVKHDKNGKITFATVDNPSFSTVQVGDSEGPKFSATTEGNISVSDKEGTNPVKITNVKDGEISKTSKDAINGSQFHKLANNTIKLAGQNGDDASGETEPQNLNQKDGIKFTVKSSDGKLLEVTAGGDTITITPKTGTITTTNGVPTATTTNGKLVTADNLVKALTEMGWKATAGTDGTGSMIGTGAAEELIKAGNTVTFKAGDNLAIKQAGKNFIYSLNPELTGLTSAEFKNKAGDKTVINNEGVTITPVTNGKQPVSLTKNGLDNGGNPITNVGSNLDGAKAGTDVPTTNHGSINSTDATDANYVNPKNAATVGDVLQAGWNLQGNNTAVDFVKPYDTVNFVDGDGTTVTVINKDTKTSTVKYSINPGNGLEKDDTTKKVQVKRADKSLTVEADGVKVNPGDKSLKTTEAGLTVNTADKSLEVTDDGLKVKTDTKTITTSDNGLTVNTGTVNAVTEGDKKGTVEVPTADAGKIATVDTVAKAVNNASFTLKASAITGGTRNTGSTVTATGESIKAGNTIEMIAGKNLDVTHNTNGKIIFATVENPSFSTVQIGNSEGPKFSATTDGNIRVSDKTDTKPVKITNVADGTISDSSKDAINGSQIHKLVNKAIKLAGQNGSEAAGETEPQTLTQQDPIKFTVKSSDGSLLHVEAAGSTITLTPKTGTITTTGGVPTATTTNGKLVTADEVVNALKEMGWKAIAGTDGTGTMIGTGAAEELIKAGNTVTFKAGDNLAIKQADRNFIYSLNTDLTGLTSAEFKDGNNNAVKITPNGVSFKKPNATDADTVTLNQNGLNNGGNPITNVAGNLQGAKTGTDAPTTSATAPSLGTGTDQVNKNNAATVGDVLNAGWNLQEKGTAKDFVTAYDTVNFIDGDGTTVSVENTDNKNSKIKYSVNLSDGLEKTNDNKIKAKASDGVTVGADGIKVNTGKGLKIDTADGNKVAVNTDGTTITVDNDGKVKAETGSTEVVTDANKGTGEKVGQVRPVATDKGKLATVDTVAQAVNSAKWIAKATNTGVDIEDADKTDDSAKPGEGIAAGDEVTFTAGKNLRVNRSGKNFTFATDKNVSFDSVKVGDTQNGKAPVNLTTEGATTANNNEAGKAPTTALNISSGTGADAKPTQLVGVGSVLNKETINTTPAGTVPAGTTPAVPTTSDLVDLNGTVGAPVNKNAAATVGDLQNMGWKVSSDKTTGADGAYLDVVKNANEVRFVGKNAAKVSGKTENGVRTITIDVPDVKTAELVSSEDGSVIAPSTDSKLQEALKAAKDELAALPKDATPEKKKEAENKVKAAETALSNAVDNNGVATAKNVADMINKSGFTLKTSEAEGGKKDTTSTGDEVINPGKAVEMVAGKNLTVKQEANGKVTYSLNPVLSNLTSAEFKADGKPTTKISSDGITITPAAPTTGGEQKPNVSLTENGLNNGGNAITDVAGNLDGAKANTQAPTTNATAPNTTDKNGDKYINPNNAATVGDVLNAGWNLQNNGAARDFVKPYDTVNFVDGLNTKAVVTTNAEGKVSNVQIDVKDLPIAYTNESGDKVVKAADGKYYKESDLAGKVYDPETNQFKNADGTALANQPTEVAGNTVRTNLVNPNAEANKAGNATQLGNVANGASTFAPVDGKVLANDGKWYNATDVEPNGKPKDGVTPVDNPLTPKNAAGEPLVQAKDGKWYKPSDLQPNGTPTPTAQPQDNAINNKAGLVDFSNSTPNNVATVGDLQNMGWVVSAQGNSYSDQVRNANEVKFVGEGTASVTGKTDDKGVRTITVKVDDQVSTNNSVTPVVYTDKDGNTVYPIKDEQGNVTYHTTPDGKGENDKVVPNGDVNTSINGPKDDQGNTRPASLSNVKNNIPVVNDADKKVTNADGTDKPDAGNVANINKAPLTAEEAADLLKPTTKDGKSNPNFVGNNAATVSDVLNAGWNLQNNGAAKDFVKPYDTVNFVSGLNTTAVVTTSDDGTTSHVTYNVTGLPVTYTTADGTPVSKIGDKFYKVNDKGQPIDEQGNPSTKVNSNGEPIDGNGNVINAIDTAANPLKTSLVNPAPEANKTGTTSPTTLDNVTSKLANYSVPDVNGKVPVRNNLVDLSKPENGQPNVSDNTVATVGDLRNMGWIVSADKKTDDLTKDYSDTVKNANEVKFVGEGTAIVSGKTDDKGVRTITVKVDDQTSTNNSVTPIVYTKADGTQVYPTNKKDDQGHPIFNTKADGSGDEVLGTDVVTSVNGPNGTKGDKAPTTLKNVKNNIPNVNDGAKTITNPDGTEKAGDVENINKAPLTAAQAAELSNLKMADGAANPKYIGNNAATVSDVLNAGWNLQNNGTAKDFVKPYDTVNFINGLGTTAVVTTREGNTTSDVTFNVKPANGSVTVDEDGVKVTTGEITSNTNGSVAGPTTPENAKTLKDALDAAVKELATAKDALKAAETELAAKPNDPALKQAVEDKKAQVTAKQTPVNDAQKAHDDAGLNKVATVQNVAEAINNAGFNLKTSADGGEKLTTGSKNDGELIKPGNTVEMVAGNNLTVKQDEHGKITYATKDDVTFKTVDTGTLTVGNPNTYTDGKGNTYTKVGENYYKPADVVNGTPKPDATPVDVTTTPVTQVSPVTMKTEAAKPAKNNATDEQPSSALNVTSKDGKPTQITGVGSTLNTNVVKTTPEGTTAKPGTTPKTEDVHLVDLKGTDAAPVNKNAAATVGDLQNMGWVVSAKDGNGYKDVVKNANVVDFKGDQGVTVTGKTLSDGTREITVGIKEGEVTNKVTITHADGTKTDAVKIGDNYYKVDENGKPVGYEKGNDGKPAGTPLTINPTEDKVTNNGAGVVTGNAVANAIQDSGWNVGIGSTDKDFSKDAKVYDKVNPNDDVKFANGANTNVSMVTVDALNEDGTKKATTYVKVDINRDLKIDSVTTGGTATDKNGNNLVKVGDQYYKEGDVTIVTNPDGTTTVTPKENAKAVPPADVIPAKDGAMIVKNADGKDVVSATVGKDGNGAFGINGKDGKNGISMTAKDGQGTIGVNGKDGKSTTIAGDTITIKDKDNNATNIGVNTITLVDKAGNTTTTTADKSEIKDAAGNINANTATGNTLKDPNGNTHTSTASTSELKDKDGNTNTSTPTTNVLKDTNGNTNTSAATGTTYKDKDENKTVVGPKEINISDKSGENTASLTNKDLLLNAKDPNTGVDKTSHVSGDKIAFTTTDEMEKVVDKDGKPVIDPATGKQKEVVKMEKVFDKDGKPVIDPATGKQKEVVKNPGNSTEYTNEGLKVIPNSTVARDVNGNPTFLDKDGKPVMKDTDGKYKYVGQDGKPGDKYDGSVGALKPNVVDNTRVISFGMDKPVLDKNGKPVTGPDGNPVMTEGISAGMQRVHNVAPGRISPTSTDAVNGSQLYAVASNIGNLNNKINKVGKRGDAGIASALAAANIPQAYTPGKSLVGIAAGSYQGQNGLAVGMSRISDNGKIIIRLSGTANSQGKTGVAAGVGYQW